MTKSKTTKDKKLNIYFHIAENSGVGYYRMQLAHDFIKKNKLANVKHNKYDKDQKLPLEKVEIEEWAKIGRWADIVIFQRRDTREYNALINGMRSWFKKPMIVESDDNVFEVPSYNPGYQNYNKFNQEVMDWAKVIARSSSAMIVTTEELKRVYSSYCPDIYICPNSLDIAMWDKLKNNNEDVRKDGKIRIGWEGSVAHDANLKIIVEPIAQILRKYPNVEYHTFGKYAYWDKEEYKDIRDRIFMYYNEDKNDKRIAYRSFTLSEYPKVFAKMGLDIAVAPLLDNLFNRSKSNLRFLEYSALSIPTVASKSYSYDCIKDGETGFKVDNTTEAWVNALSELVESYELRKQIGKNANQQLRDEYNMDKNCIMWVDTCKKVIEKYELGVRTGETNFPD